MVRKRTQRTQILSIKINRTNFVVSTKCPETASKSQKQSKSLGNMAFIRLDDPWNSGLSNNEKN